MASKNSLQSVLTQAGLAIAPLCAVKTADQAVTFFRQLGYEIPSGAFGDALSNLAGQAGQLVAVAQQLANASDAGSIAMGIASAIERLTVTVNAVKQLHAQVQSGGAGALPDIGDLPRRMTDFLILDYFDRLKPNVHETLLVLGLIEYEPAPTANQPMRLINWDRFGQFLTKPSQIATDVYQWDTGFDTNKFLTRLQGLMRSVELPGGMYPQTQAVQSILGNTTSDLQELRFPLLQTGLTPQTYGQFGITFSPVDAQGSKMKGIALLPYIMGVAGFQFNVCDRGQLTFQSSADITGVGVVIRPPLDAEGILNVTGDFSVSLQIQEKPATAQETILIGSPGGSRLSVQGLGISWFAKNTAGKLDLGVLAQMQAIRLVVGGGDGDGFIQEILSGLNINAEAQLGFGMSLLSGFVVTGGGKLAIELSVHIDIGPVSIHSLQLTLAPAADRFDIGAGVSLSADLGPLKAAVDGIGLQAALQFKQGNLGPAQLDISFLPPKGVGLSVDAGIVTGGGYLYIDADRGQYAGALELVFADFLSLHAIGLINTKMPDGSSGFSLLIIITADFGAGIQLGFGFTLLAVGGLLGLNRMMLFQPLLDGVRTDSIESIMFPQNVVANAQRIISDLQAIFPPQKGTFLIGPMAKLGWGEPTLVSLSLGIIIEIPPGDIAILGILKIALPADDIAILVLQVNFAGALEFDKKRLYFFASLFDSHILFITIDGEMGVLFAYGDDANFVLSVGGFHPQFNPPPLPFPLPTRIQINIINESYARIQCDAYFAVTTNTVQFGTHSSYFFGFSALSVEGQSGFDALFQFSPFYFTVEISCSFSVKVFGLGVYGVGIDLSLSGPTPWHAHGTASLSFLFFSIGIGIDFTWGDSQQTTLPPIAVMPVISAEFAKQSNWRAVLPASSNLLVSLRPLDASVASFVLHPVGTLQVSQRAIPLDLTLDKVGNQQPTDANRFSLTVTSGGLAKNRDLQDKFAPSQFKNFDDATKLSQPAFQNQDSGIELSVTGNSFASATANTRNVRYNLTIIDTTLQRRPFYKFSGSIFTHFLGGASVTRSVFSAARKTQMQPFAEKVTVASETFAVANAADNKVYHPEAAAFTSQTSANDYVARAVASDPTLAGTLIVLPQFEVAA